MDREKTKAYASRICEANRSELVVIIYELILDSIGTAREALADGDRETADTELKRAQGLLREMRGSLDFQYGISRRLAMLYRYVNEQLARSIAARRDIGLDSCERVIGGLKESFEQIARQDTSGAVMDSSQHVYAGLTYGKGRLNEVAVDVHGTGRDFCV